MSEEMPLDWKVDKLGNLTKVITKGTTPRTYSSDGVNFIKVESVSRYGTLLPDKFAKIHVNIHESQKRSQLMCGDMLFGIAGSLGRLAVVREQDLPANTNQALAIIRLNKGAIERSFCLHQLSSNRMQLEIKSLQTVGAQPNLSLQQVSDFEILLPPLPEQKKIASILTSVDDVIEKTQAQINRLQDLKKGTMNELLTRGIGHTEFKESPVGMIPVDWEVLPLAKVCKVSSSKRVMQSDYVDKGVPFYRSKEIILKSKGKAVNSVLYISDEQFLNLASKFGAPVCGDVLITAVGTIGVCYLVGHEKFYFKDGNLLWLKDIDILEPHFLSVFLSSHRARERIIEISGGSSQSALTIEKLSDFFVPIPSKYEQEKLSQIAASIDERIDSQKHKLNHTQSLKKALMQDLLTGKVRVTVS